MGLIRVAWKVTKLVLAGAILWGAFRAVSPPSTTGLAELIAAAQRANPTFPGGGFLFWIADDWMPLAIASVFWNSLATKRLVQDLQETSGFLRIFIGTLLNYLKLTPRVRTQDEILQKGKWRAMVDYCREWGSRGISSWESWRQTSA